ncbi:MAG TPA: agmatine deiminase family protein [Myxococcota bacterium]|nr:agmatine deiminase family protein [Myxococcota bacterium]
MNKFTIPLALLVSAGLTCSCGDGGDRARDSFARLSTGERVSTSLPNWATAEELEIQRQASAPVVLDRTPPASGLRLPAEYEPAQAVVMTWTTYTGMLQEISVATADAGAEVWMVGGPSSISGVPQGQYARLNVAFDSVWARDYGPYGIDEVSGALGIIDTTYRHYATRPDDDAIPCEVASFAGASCYSTSLILDGGNLMTDGQGNLFMTKRIYDWNSGQTQAQVDQLLKNYYGVVNIYALDYAKDSWGDPADGTGHIDMFAKLLAPCKVLVAETSDQPFVTPLDDAAAFFAALQCAAGQKYQVYRISGWYSFGTWYTYTNSLIVNQTAIIPSYSGADNQQARQVYQAALPGYSVVLVDSDASITSGGSVHCITKEIPLMVTGCQSPADCDLPHVDQHSCVSGDCGIISCDGGWADCDGTSENGCETALGSDTRCTGCTDDCTDDFAHAAGSCQSGACVMGVCLGNYADCDGATGNGCETILGGDTHCSGCVDDCTDDFTHAAGICLTGVCSIGACAGGYADCDLQLANGCEVELGTDDDCSACGDSCAYKFAHSVGECVADACQIKYCADYYGDCNASPADGCETALGNSQDCGACGDSCAAGEDCAAEAGDYHCISRGCRDADHDGYSDAACGGTDCNDAVAAVNPGTQETCNEQDDNCDGEIDEGEVCGTKPSSGCACGTGSGDRPGCVFLMLLLLTLFSRRKK